MSYELLLTPQKVLELQRINPLFCLLFQYYKYPCWEERIVLADCIQLISLLLKNFNKMPGLEVFLKYEQLEEAYNQISFSNYTKALYATVRVGVYLGRMYRSENSADNFILFQVMNNFNLSLGYVLEKKEV